ncbi:protein LURP-one-related 8-like [Telopea speciosissima]|uniref:protein LURP-one-related 8-like n=1 Tax=Telopea speciosissima TaxID=54955 RepID=UPI001CC770F1|nr:protein LURP-one-related 8-like [Telopea speciosissima]
MAMDEEQGATLSNTNPTSPVHLTVWHQSLLFNGNGYTVYDGLNGNLVFRVENYACDWKQEMFLMDSSGHVLFTISRRTVHLGKKLCIMESWEAFKGDKEVVRYGIDGRQKPFMVATKTFRNPSCSITVATGDKYQIKWSYQEGWLKIFPETSLSVPIAQVSRKCGTTPESNSSPLGKDVFTLIVHQRVDQAMVMAMVMISDAMMR